MILEEVREMEKYSKEWFKNHPPAICPDCHNILIQDFKSILICCYFKAWKFISSFFNDKNNKSDNKIYGLRIGWCPECKKLMEGIFTYELG
jgi:hypothetical protein